MTQVRIFFLLAFLGLVAYSNAIHHPFVHDDIIFIQNNPNIADLNLVEVFKKPVLNNQQSLVNDYYRPLIETTHRLQYQLFGMNPHGFHFFNIILHIINGFILFLILLKMLGKNTWISLTAALIFIVHPLQSEAVACVSGVSNLLFTFFFFLSVFLYLKYRDQSNVFCYIASLILFFVSFFVKEQTIILPFILLLYEFTVGNKSSSELNKRLPYIGGFFITLTVYFLIRKFLLNIVIFNPFEHIGELWLRMLSIPQTLLTYLKLIVFPSDLHYFRTTDILAPFWMPLSILVFIIGISFVIYKKLPNRQRSIFKFGLGWFLISLFPMLNIVPLVLEYSLILTMEHFLYLPMIGVLLMLFAILDYFLIDKIKKKKSFSTGLLVVIVLICVFLTSKQNQYWAGEISLFKQTLKYQDSGRIRILLAKAYHFNKQYELSNKEYFRALEIMNSYLDKIEIVEVRVFYLGFVAEINFDIAKNYEFLGKKTEAIKYYRDVIIANPNFGPAYNNLGVLYLNLRDVPKAIEYFEKAVELDSNNLFLQNNLAICYINNNQKDKAVTLLKEIIKKEPNFVMAQKNLERLLKDIKN